MGNSFQKVYLDNKSTDETKTATNERKSKCRSPDNKILLFDELHNHSFYIFPQELTGLGATMSHKLTRHTHLSHTANVDVLSENREKSYLLDVQWYGCEECHYSKSQLSKHIGSLMASMSLNPFEYFPNSHTLNFKKLALNYTTNKVATGIWMQNFVVGDRTVLTSLSNPHEISKNCNHFGAEFTFAVTPSILIGFRAKCSSFDNGFARIDKSNCISFASRVALPSNAAVFSTQIGEGAIDLQVSTNLIPELQVAVALHSSMKNVAENSVNYGFKFTLPDESAMISVAVDNNWKVKASVKKQMSIVPVVFMATSEFSPTASHDYSHKFGIGIEMSF